jgi:hypothetical protein
MKRSLGSGRRSVKELTMRDTPYNSKVNWSGTLQIGTEALETNRTYCAGRGSLQ